jgi:hypothetical protein
METITDSIKVNATPEQVFNWLVQRMKDKESYRAWHPDHVDVRWIRGEPFQEGSVLYAEEYLHGELHKLKFLIVRIVPNKEIIYKALFPVSLFAPQNAFFIEPKGESSCIFTATGSFRAGPLFKRFGKNMIEATKQHMKEEGENLKSAVEKGEVRQSGPA